MFPVGNEVGVFRSGFLVGGRWYLQIGWGVGGGGNGRGSGSRGFGIGGGLCYETRLEVFVREVVLFVVFESDAGVNKYIQYWWVSSQDGDESKFYKFLFLEQGYLGKMMGAKVVVEVNLDVTAKID